MYFSVTSFKNNICIINCLKIIARIFVFKAQLIVYILYCTVKALKYLVSDDCSLADYSNE